MLQILYYIYVGIRSFHPVMPFIKTNDLIAIAPIPADLMRPLAIGTFTNWLDDIYLNPRVRASTKSSRFAESEDYSHLPSPTHRPRHSTSTSWPPQNGTVQRSAPGNILTLSRNPTVTAGTNATHGSTPTLLLRPTLAIVLKILFVCPPSPWPLPGIPVLLPGLTILQPILASTPQIPFFCKSSPCLVASRRKTLETSLFYATRTTNLSINDDVPPVEETQPKANQRNNEGGKGVLPPPAPKEPQNKRGAVASDQARCNAKSDPKEVALKGDQESRCEEGRILPHIFHRRQVLRTYSSRISDRGTPFPDAALNSNHRYPTMPSKISKRPPRKTPPE